MNIERHLFAALRLGSRSAPGRAVLDRYLAPMNPFDVRRFPDPYPIYRQLRTHGSVAYHPKLDMWLVTGYGAALTSLRADVSCDRSDMAKRLHPYNALQPVSNDVMLDNLLMQDAPRHTELRRAMGSYFAPASIDHLTDLTRSVTEDRLDRIDRTRGPATVDVVAELLRPVSAAVNARILGVDPDRVDLDRLARVLVRYGEPLAGFKPGPVDDAVVEAMNLYDRYAVRDRAEGSLWEQVATAFEPATDRSASDLTGSFALQLIAGHETIVGLMGNAMVALATADADDTFRQRLAGGNTEERIDAVEELARYDSPIQVTDRTTLVDLELDGHHIPAGSVLLIFYGAANRDPDHFADPDRLQADRPESRSLSFGSGPHRCIGAHLGVAMAVEVLSAVLQRFPRYTLAPESGVQWSQTFTLRRPEALAVRMS